MNEPTPETESAETTPLKRTVAEELAHAERARRTRERLRTRTQRQLGHRPKSLKARELTQESKREAAPLFDWSVREEVAPRPKTRGDCAPCEMCEVYNYLGDEAPVFDILACGHRPREVANHCRPCPWVGCRQNLYLDVKEDGHLRYNHPGKELEELAETCALDVADRGEQSREAVGDLCNMTGQRITSIERDARVHLRVVLGVDEVSDERGDA